MGHLLWRIIFTGGLFYICAAETQRIRRQDYVFEGQPPSQQQQQSNYPIPSDSLPPLPPPLSNGVSPSGAKKQFPTPPPAGYPAPGAPQPSYGPSPTAPVTAAKNGYSKPSAPVSVPAPAPGPGPAVPYPVPDIGYPGQQPQPPSPVPPTPDRLTNGKNGAIKTNGQKPGPKPTNGYPTPPPTNGYPAPGPRPTNGYPAPVPSPTNGYPAPVPSPTNGYPAPSPPAIQFREPAPNPVNDDYSAPAQVQANAYPASVVEQTGYPAPPPDQGNAYAVAEKLTEEEETAKALMMLQMAVPGNPGVDYPILSVIPQTNFQCSSQELPGYYADLDAQCQVFWVCSPEGKQDGFLCANGTIFRQEYFGCDWWYNVKCQESPNFYGLNTQLFVSPKKNNGATGFQTNQVESL